MRRPARFWGRRWRCEIPLRSRAARHGTRDLLLAPPRQTAPAKGPRGDRAIYVQGGLEVRAASATVQPGPPGSHLVWI